MLRPHGRVIAVSGTSLPTEDDMAPIFEHLSDQLRPDHRQQARAVPTVAANVGLTVIHEDLATTTAPVSPNDLADAIADRLFSHLWDLSSSQWQTHVEPAIKQLRALPDPDEARQRTFQHPLVVLAKQ